jgi:hypothetical protein
VPEAFVPKAWLLFAIHMSFVRERAVLLTYAIGQIYLDTQKPHGSGSGKVHILLFHRDSLQIFHVT